VKKFLLALCAISLVLSACTAEKIYTPEDTALMYPESGQISAVVAIPESYVEECNDPWAQVAMEINGDEAETWMFCREYSGEVDIIDAAMVLTLASPLPGDEAIVGVVWLGKVAIKLIVVAGTAVIAGQTIVQVSGGHSSDDHSPWIKGSRARVNIGVLILAATATIATTGGFDPNKFKCGVIKSGDLIIRAAIFMVDVNVSKGGTLSWWDTVALDRHWGGSYDVTQTKFETGMSQETLTKNKWTWETMDCNDPNFPGSGGLPPLQPAR